MSAEDHRRINNPTKKKPKVVEGRGRSKAFIHFLVIVRREASISRSLVFMLSEFPWDIVFHLHGTDNWDARERMIKSKSPFSNFKKGDLTPGYGRGAEI